MRHRDARADGGALRSVRDLGFLLFVAAALVVGLIHFSLARSSDDRAASRDTPAAGGASRTSAAVQGGVTCWNGARAAQLAQCTQPSGLAGLRWVFPSLARSDVSCHPAPGAAGAYQAVIGQECSAQVAGQPVSITYEQVASTTGADAAIDQAFPQGEMYQINGADGGRCTWFDPTGQPARATGYYEGYPYVVSLLADRPDVAKRAWMTLVSFRPPGSVLGVRR